MGGFSYPESYSFQSEMVFDGFGAGMAGIFLVIYLFCMLLATGFSLAVYVLQSVGLHTIANRRGIRHGWLAWLPFGNMWILGSVSDQYQYVVKGKIKNRRKTLLGLNIITVATAIVVLIAVSFSAIVQQVSPVLLIALVLPVLAVVLTVQEYFAFYDLFRSCDPGNAVLYLVLSIFISAALPFFVFASRKKDLGMPPRKKSVVEAAPVAEETPVEEEGFAQPEEFEE